MRNTGYKKKTFIFCFPERSSRQAAPTDLEIGSGTGSGAAQKMTTPSGSGSTTLPFFTFIKQLKLRFKKKLLLPGSKLSLNTVPVQHEYKFKEFFLF